MNSENSIEAQHILEFAYYEPEETLKSKREQLFTQRIQKRKRVSFQEQLDKRS